MKKRTIILAVCVGLLTVFGGYRMLVETTGAHSAQTNAFFSLEAFLEQGWFEKSAFLQERTAIDAATGLEVQSVEDAEYTILLSGRDEQGMPLIQVWSRKQQGLLFGMFQTDNNVWGTRYYFDLETGNLKLGSFEIPYRGMEEKTMTLLSQSVPGAGFGQIQTGWVYDSASQTSRYYIPFTGAMVQNEFYATPQGVVYADGQGRIQTGLFEVLGDTYESNEQGIVVKRNGEDFLEKWTVEEDYVVLKVKDQTIWAARNSQLAAILHAAAGPVQSAQYASGGRNSETQLDCLGFSMLVLNKAFGLDLEGASVNDFVTSEANGEFIEEEDLEIGDLVIYKATYLPLYGVYTHAAVYVGKGQVLSMGNDGVSLCSMEDILDYYGAPAPRVYYRVLGSPNEAKG